MRFNREQLVDLICSVKYYMNTQISIRNPRYDEFKDILETLEKEMGLSNIPSAHPPYNRNDLYDD